MVCTPQEVALLDATRAITMFRQLKVPVLGMVENMSFFDVVAYLKERGGPEAHKHIDGKGYFDVPGDERIYIFGRGGARRKAEQLASRSSAKCRSTSSSAKPATQERWRHALLPGSPGAAVSARRCRAARRPDQHPEHQDTQDAQARGDQLTSPQRRAPGRRPGRLAVLQRRASR